MEGRWEWGWEIERMDGWMDGWEGGHLLACLFVGILRPCQIE